MLVRKNKFTINPGLVEFTPSMKSVQDEIDSIKLDFRSHDMHHDNEWLNFLVNED